MMFYLGLSAVQPSMGSRGPFQGFFCSQAVEGLDRLEPKRCDDDRRHAHVSPQIQCLSGMNI